MRASTKGVYYNISHPAEFLHRTLTCFTHSSEFNTNEAISADTNVQSDHKRYGTMPKPDLNLL